MKLAVCLSSLCLLIGLAQPAYGDADVEVDPRAPKLGVKAVRVEPSVGGNVSLRAGGHGGKKRPPFIRFQCPVDADVGNYGCRRTPDSDDDGVDLSEGDILRAVREIGLPRLEVRVQPGERTLVNVRTIFSTDPQQFRRSVELLGFDVDLVASPVSYTWNHGDGTRRSTNRPGRPYPSFDVTHRYRKAADVVRPSVDVTYRVRYRVDAGTWSTLSQTVTAPGPAAELEVREAVPVLTAP